jgi:hypothetical protein
LLVKRILYYICGWCLCSSLIIINSSYININRQYGGQVSRSSHDHVRCDYIYIYQWNGYIINTKQKKKGNKKLIWSPCNYHVHYPSTALRIFIVVTPMTSLAVLHVVYINSKFLHL